MLNIPTETKRGIKLLGLIPRFVFLKKTYLCTDMAKENVTPMMKQFYELKAKNPDAVMLFRCGDFYETYCEDAVTASKILGITLTKRNNKGQAAAIDMAGFPFHALDTYLPKLIRAGHRVAICDQLEDPKTTNKLVKRGITELVTPGVSMNDNVLNCKENNFLAAINFGRSTVGLSLLDISTGEFLVAEGVSDYIEKLLSNFSPKEVLYERGKKKIFESCFGNKFFTYEMDDWTFAETTANEKLLHHFQVKNLKGFGVDHLKSACVAAGVILIYLEQTQHNHTQHITSLSRIDEERYVRLDKFTIRNLELLTSMNEGGQSLLSVIDEALTPMGARMLHRWLLFPLRDIKAIERRQDGVEYFFRQPDFRAVCEESLAAIGDLERIVSKVSVERANPRELQQLRIALEAIVPVKKACEEADQPTLQLIGRRLDGCEALCERLRKELRPDPPILLNKGGVIAPGVNAELDDLRHISTSGKDYLLQIQQREIEATGIPSLKIGFNNVFGYYIEVRNTYKDRVPEGWIRKQTLVSAERYITQELKQYEEKILGAEERILALENRLYLELLQAASCYIGALQEDARLLAEIDCLLSMAKVAERHKYVRPVVDDSLVIDIKQGRHPVIETLMPIGESYVANDVYLDNEKQQIIIITGPNMAGKSALLRQTALIVLLAQTGSFVPADSARIGLVDKIFTRVGASDNISLGESTFMVEMSEAANIMNNLTPRSLILFDELGRGTSTYDGISIAWAIVERIHEDVQSRARMLFATHYHELNEMEKLFPRIRNYNVSVREVNGRIVFLRKLVEGGSAHSFGIHVARLAGMPRVVVERADEILKDLERNNSDNGVSRSDFTHQEESNGMQLNFFQLDDPVLVQIRDEIKGLDINNLTPMEALNKLNEIQKIVSGQA